MFETLKFFLKNFLKTLATVFYLCYTKFVKENVCVFSLNYFCYSLGGIHYVI